jgi:serine/threonine-protein kinase
MARQTPAGGPAPLGAYEIVRPLGEGGMGQVFLARKRGDSAEVVIKQVHDRLASDPRMRQSLAREVQVLRRFRHKNAVALLDADLEGTRPYLVMEYVPGVSLEQLLAQRGRFTPLQVGRLLGQLAPVLQAAHDRGILHRDLTPANLMVIDPDGPGETLKVMDFGLALASGFYVSLEKLQGSTASIGGGTPDYVCPEQVRGESVDHRGDLYSVGVSLFQLLTGHLPFEAAGATEEILSAHLHRLPPFFADVGVNDVPPALESLVRRCLGKYPHDRPGSARLLAEEYQQALGTPILAADAFAAAVVPEPEPLRPAFDPHAVLDRFEAWMPEQVALVKLRGFVDGVGGTVVESLPGVIKVELPSSSSTAAAPSGFWSWFRAPTPPSAIRIELHFEKKMIEGRNLVAVTVVQGAGQPRSPETARICMELRAYLMIGR